MVDFTALGDTVNVAARMQECAAAGELLIARGVADEIVARAPRHTLILKRHEPPMEAFVLAQVSGAILCPRGTLHTTKLTSNCSKHPGAR